MKRLANLAMVAILAGCGSDSSLPVDPPVEKFAGTWSGAAFYPPYSADTIHFTIVAIEGGGNVSGTVNYQAPVADTTTFTGTSTPPTVNFEGPSRFSSYTFAGAYVTSDSIAGMMDYNGFQTDPLSLKKISSASGGEFSGTWSGVDSTDSPASPALHLLLIATQTGTAINASGIFSTDGPVETGRSFTGTATSSTVSFKWTGSRALLRYTGTYVTNDSIFGSLKVDGVDDVLLSLKRN